MQISPVPPLITRWIPRILALASVVLLVPAAPAQAPSPEGPRSGGAGPAIVLQGRVIDGTGRPAIEEGIVVVRDGWIQCAGRAGQCAVPRDAQVIDAGGGTILPGLIGLHAHLTEPFFRMLLPAGVTTVRDVSNRFARLDSLERVGPYRPRLIAAGVLIDGPEGAWEGVHEVSTPEEARAAVEENVRRGAAFVKLYNRLPEPLFAAAVQRARELGVPVTADLMDSEVDALEALELGVDGLEHASGLVQAYERLGGDPDRPGLDAGLVDSLARAIVGHGAYLVPTLIVHRQIAGPRLPLDGVPMADRVPEGLLGYWRQFESPSERLRARFAREQRMARAVVARVHELGGRIGAGTDFPNPYVTPGGALHQELELLVDVGLSPVEAIHAATGAAADILGRPELGVIAPGRVADLIVVRGDPTADIRATRGVHTVIQGGRVLPMDSLLAQAPRLRGGAAAAEARTEISSLATGEEGR